jgi:hypothetical protein
MNTLTRRFPNFCDVDPSDRTKHQFSTTTELFAVDWVKQLAESPEHKCFSVSGKDRPVLMHELTDGTYWGIGYLDSLEGVDLPEWQSPWQSKTAASFIQAEAIIIASYPDAVRVGEGNSYAWQVRGKKVGEAWFVNKDLWQVKKLSEGQPPPQEV